MLKLSLVNLAVNQGFRINAVVPGGADTLLTQGTCDNPSKHSKLAEIVGVIWGYIAIQETKNFPLIASVPVQVRPRGP